MKEKYLATFMQEAFNWSKHSSARRLKVGAVAVKNGVSIATGYNGTGEGDDNNCEHEENGVLRTKADVIHAEENLILHLAMGSASGIGCEIFVTHWPCKSCAVKLARLKPAKIWYAKEYRDDSGVQYLSHRKGIPVERLPLPLNGEKLVVYVQTKLDNEQWSITSKQFPELFLCGRNLNEELIKVPSAIRKIDFDEGRFYWRSNIEVEVLPPIT